ncbi:hypothetical protein DL98DRAFT_517210 [Cadophora sp. DSE1049]|nr:hypothetical protein DL98DRAFT_517210 [Cadophora sp. DSE1049]
MTPKNKTAPLCGKLSNLLPASHLELYLTLLSIHIVTTSDRALLKAKLLTHLSTHPSLSFPSPSIPQKDRIIPIHIISSLSSYTPFSSLLSTVHKAPLKLPLTGQQWHWLRKFCYASFFYRGASTSGFQELVPRGFLRLSAAERGFVRSELGKANGQARAKMVPQGAMVVAM